MKDLLIENKDGTFTVNGADYTLAVRGCVIDVLVKNNVFASLDVRSAVHKTNDTNDGFTPDEESAVPSLISAGVKNGRAEFVWKNNSALWGKTYTLRCDRLRFYYTVSVEGNGRVDAVDYFSAAGKGSGYEFSQGFNPCVSYCCSEDYAFRASVGCHRQSILTVPPMFCYAFRREGVGDMLGLGLAAKRGQHNFHSFDYKVFRSGFGTSFMLSTDQLGHETVDGEWTAPCIIGYSGADQFDVYKKYSDYYFSSGIAKPKKDGKKPRFWYGPFVCGWIEQEIRAAQAGEEPFGYANEKIYDKIAAAIRRYGLRPSALIVDDKWQKTYDNSCADPDKFPDMRAYVERRRGEGMRTLLWFKLWDREGTPDSGCVLDENGRMIADPSRPQFKQKLGRTLRTLLSDEEGCCNCDGFKLDFAMDNPVGRSVKTYSGKYGVELLYDYMSEIYHQTKKIKPEALINCSPCHPYFAHICDMARLHDYEPRNRDNRADMSKRAKLFSIAMPGVLIDTDNAGFCSYDDSFDWLMNQRLTGVPDLYTSVGTDGCPMNDADFEALRQTWSEYSAIIDGMFD